MELIDATSSSVVTDTLRPERDHLVNLLNGLDTEQWDLPTECPAYSVKGIATHILGDDLSLLSRQRDNAVQGLVLFAEDHPGASFMDLLNGFNDQWVNAARFLSPPLLLELLRLSGEWSAAYYEDVDPLSDGEPVGLFNPAMDAPSPFWHAIVREYLERWSHHSQIRRAVGHGALSDDPFFEVGIRIVASAAKAPVGVPDSPDGDWAIGPLVLGPRSQAAEILTLGHHEEEVLELVDGPAELVAMFAQRVCRRDPAATT